ncbi:hypothetical protein N8I77_012505 [Diaporthe amygdali]|uniref:Uncharacterized protein n=1 Tax=Phomopsis amygdali TaxID=1214568 RepID=A0AAD9S456_PHOAM|nr:hypothetical protein N8I77_012505 [Diaporthe amygdali]
MRRTVSAPAWVRVSPTAAYYSYPQIKAYQNPARVRQGPLVVMNPDPGSEAERVRDEAVRELEREKTVQSTRVTPTIGRQDPKLPYKEKLE